ncbi:MAG: sigma-70 family RNA polymerase sigma factor [Armatimonadota bacterium]
MPKLEINEPEMLTQMWDAHRDFLRRLLISLTHDVDLADDLLHDTYLKALAGSSSYRGGDTRAWLSVIAKNAFYAHLRQRYVRCETELNNDIDAQVEWTSAHLDLMELRRAVDSLSDTLRITLIMKHYGGYTYEEIANHLSCPVGTAKRRVSVALRILRNQLSIETGGLPEMKCTGLADRLLMDYTYGSLSESDEQLVREHLISCKCCRDKAKQIKKLLTSLDAVEAEYKITAIVELGEDGTTTEYISLRLPDITRNSGVPAETMEIGGNGLVYLTVDDKEASFEVLPSEPENGMHKYRIYLPYPVSPGQGIDLHIISKPADGKGWAEKLKNGRWRLCGKIHLTDSLVYVTAVRLPSGARLTKAEPTPSEVKKDCTTTVVWRNVLPPNQTINFELEYQ